MERDMVLKKTSALLGATVIMTAAWSFDLPGANLTMMTFALLSSSALCSIPDLKRRTAYCLQMICGAAATQFLISITAKYPQMRIVVPMLFSFFVLAAASDRQAAVIILLIAYLAILAPPGLTEAVNRCADIAFAGIAALTAASLSNIFTPDVPEKIASVRSGSLRHAAVITAELTGGSIISQIINHEQAAWIMLTILFIHLAESPQTPPAALAGKRIAATLSGIILGGMYLSAFCSVNYRMIYIAPFAGAFSFFVLYLKNDYFLFTFLFMFTVTIFSDWMAGNSRSFAFTEIMFVRSMATVIGALLLLCGEKMMQKEIVS